MKPTPSSHKIVPSILVAGVALCSIAASARADVKVVSQVDITGSPSQSRDQTVTTYYKGERARIESGDSIILYDRKVDKVYMLHPSDKTYSVLPVKTMLESDGPSPAQVGRNMKVDSKVDVKKADDKEPDAVKTYANTEAHKYDVTGSVKVARNSGGLGGGGFGGSYGRRRRGGGGGGGGYPGGGGGRVLPSMELTGEYWLTDKLPLSMKSKAPLLPSFVLTVPTGALAGPLLQPMAEKMPGTKGFPMYSRVTIQMQSRDQDPIVETTEVKSISEETLDDALFNIPDDYKIVDPPARPSSSSSNRG